jgi:DNA polymerase-3 subunit alpha
VGGGAIEAIIEARKDGEFADLFDFCERVDLRKVNKRVIESLVKSGAFDSSGAKRSTLMAVSDDAVSLGQKIQEERESSQVSLFGTDEIVKNTGNGIGKLPDLPEWDDKIKLGFEKEALGFFITGHPLDRYAQDMRRFTSVDTAGLSEVAEGKEVRVCGIVVALKEMTTKKGDRMGFATIEDLVGAVEVVVFPEPYAKSGEFLKSEEPLVITGTVDVGEKSTKIKASDIVPLSELTAQGTKRVHFTLNAQMTDRGQLEALRDIIGRHGGTCEALLHIDIPETCRATIPLAKNFRVAASDELALAVEKLVGYRAIRFE